MAESPSYWLSALAEELAMLADNRDAGAITAQLKYHARIHAVSEKTLTAMVTAEWVRQGVLTVPTSGILRGWVE